MIGTSKLVPRPKPVLFSCHRRSSREHHAQTVLRQRDVLIVALCWHRDDAMLLAKTICAHRNAERAIFASAETPRPYRRDEPRCRLGETAINRKSLPESHPASRGTKFHKAIAYRTTEGSGTSTRRAVVVEAHAQYLCIAQNIKTSAHI